jgi:DEAD/DEAH box helicase domain-containing protein
MRSPEALFSRKVEVPRVNTENLVVLEQHLACAAAELPLVPSIDAPYFGEVRPSSAFPFSLL